MMPAAIIQQADRYELLRCRCPLCLALDAQFPTQGFQLALFRFMPATGPLRVPRVDKHVVPRR
jgi:hypothetical protein